MEAHLPRGPYKYGYTIWRRAGTFLAMPMIALLGIFLGGFVFKTASIFVGLALFLIGLGILFLSFFGVLMCSSIVVSDGGIAACAFGRTLKSCSWKDVVAIKKVRRWNPGSRSYEDVFYVFDGQFSGVQERIVNILGPIAVSGKIVNIRMLIGQFNFFAKEYGFPLFVRDQQAARNDANLAKADPWSRSVPAVKEVQVAEF